MLLHHRLFFPGIWKFIFCHSLSSEHQSSFFSFYNNNPSIPESFKLYLPSVTYVSNVRDSVWGRVSPSTCSLLQFIPGKTLCDCIVPTPQGWSVLHRALMRGDLHCPPACKRFNTDSHFPQDHSYVPAALGLVSWSQVWLWIHVHVVYWGAALRKNLWGSKEQ